MKRIAEKTILLTTFVSLFMACSPELEDTSEKTIASLQATLDGFRGGADTRTQESGYQTSFTGNEQIGVFALKNSGDVILENNVPYKYSAGAWQPVNTNNQIHVYGTGITYYAYYPYSSSMNDKKSVAEIISAFTLPEDQSDYDKYTSADLMTGTGTLGSGSTLAFSFVHAMSLIEIKINETSNSDAPYDPAPVFYGMAPWKMPDGIYRYLVRPGADAEVAFDYGPADNRYAYQKSLAAADIKAGNYTRIAAPFKNFSMELSTGSYVATTLGPVSKVIINGNEYAATAVGGSNNKYILNGLRKIPEPLASFDVYITDNQAKAESKEQLLVSATTTGLTVDATALTVALPLSAGGMEGAGTEADPYQVTTSPQLRGVGMEGTENNSAETEYYVQTHDIDLNMYADWKPVKSGLLYDGKGFKISNLKSTRGGIFSYSGGTIQNVHLASGEITVSGKTFGGIVNISDRSGCKILKCSNAATIVSTNGGDVGGIVGSGGHSIIEYCKNSGNITVDVYGGGIAGITWGNQIDPGNAGMDTEIRYCYNIGTIVKSNARRTDGDCGGILSRLVRTLVMEYCYNAGQIIDDGSNNKVGSLTGELDNSYSKNNYGISVASSKLHYSTNNGFSSNDTFFDTASNQWPVYSTDPSNGWGSAHWKSYSQGEYPKLLWEE
ncbi:fimbrillin family protein [Bacteroides cellulosilyticus]|uniref:fimbrillin family protein n=1 Tax=Bacteroides cellulosilyticus TaxID=246787 RepID=UPI001C37905B|nr:fimbrillin family protein [Bacteroides cellulosilyticus]MBV3637503.1 fimbrillin family protein [Bacteroides cellulosilyticus]MBV3663844.1 fimbrillin family protein [Bacteroides cellulosilyticus]MBV3685835.1 fimbrillin family protein [Bacteroides cellulosilyticus]MBV3694517.1 fimbrillin family protein [Bacteroides cellulosilyticus]MBV3708043.1 fimbrillin family protein [Bacteroides cellulosilyticus]